MVRFWSAQFAGGDLHRPFFFQQIKLLGFFVFLLFAMRFFGGNPPQRDDPEGGGETSRYGIYSSYPPVSTYLFNLFTIS